MTTSYPAVLDNFTDPAAADSLAGHAQKHTDLNDAVEAIEAFIGVSGTPADGSINNRLITLETAGPGGAVSLKQVTLDLGSVPIYAKSILFTDVEITPLSKITMTAQADSDELEMDGFTCSVQAGVGSAIAYIHAIPGPVTGTRKFNYLIA